MYNIPAEYDYINYYNAQMDPSTVHIKNTAVNRYFVKYLLQKAISVFEWQLPPLWAKNYFLYSLYCFGFVAVVETDKFGVIPQACGLRGYDIFYQPTNAIITNPLLSGILEPRIGKECELIRLQPTYSGIMDIVSYYANLMAVATEALGTNLMNTKLSYVFGAENKAQAESFKKMYDEISSGEPAVFIDKQLFTDEGQPNWYSFSQNIKENYIGDELLTALRKIEAMYDTDIGIPNANTDKKERLISDEVNANNYETMAKCSLWLEQLKEDIEKVKDMFGIELSVDWRKEVTDNALDPGII